VARNYGIVQSDFRTGWELARASFELGNRPG
jgi:hypothetical protein